MPSVVVIHSFDCTSIICNLKFLLLFLGLCCGVLYFSSSLYLRLLFGMRLALSIFFGYSFSLLICHYVTVLFIKEEAEENERGRDRDRD